MTLQPTNPLPGKRLNIKLIVTALICLCAIGVGITALDRTMRARRDRQTIEWAEQAMSQGRYEDAAAQFAVAVSRHPQDPELSLKSGDALYALSASKPEVLQQAHVAWESAARMRPDDRSALDRLLRFQMDLAEVRPSTASFRSLGDIAERVISLSPSDKDAVNASQISLLGPWFAQIGSGNPAEGAAHDKLIDRLGQSLQNAPTEPAILFYALASARRAVDLQLGGGDAAAHHLLGQAEPEIAAIANRSAPDLYAVAEGLTILAQANQRLDQLRSSEVPTSQPTTTQPATTQPAAVGATPIWPTWNLLDHQINWEAGDSIQSESSPGHEPTTRPISVAAARCLEKARAIATDAAASVHSTDRRFIDVHLLEIHLAQATGDLPAAEQICRQTLADRPDNLRAQVAMADLVSVAHPDQAMEILDQPAKDEGEGPGPIALTGRQLQAEAAKLKARLNLDAASATDDPAARQVKIQKANAACDALAVMLVNDAESLKQTGRLRMFQGRYSDAIRLLDRAIGLHRRGKIDVDLLSLRASSRLALHDPQAALDNLRIALQLEPSRSAERLLLAQTLVDQARVSEAAKQVDLLEKQLPDDPRVLKLRARWLLARSAVDLDDASAMRVQEVYSKLPESNVKQKLAKAQSALSAGMAADAIRLLDSARAIEPASVPLTVETVRAMIASSRPDQARALLAGALAKHPGDVTLIAAQKSLEAPQSRDAYEASLKGDGTQEFLTAVNACRAALDAHDLPRAKDQIDRIVRLRSDEPLSSEVKFRYDLAIRQWTDAGLCADRLGQANFDHVEGLSYLFELQMAQEQPLAAVCIAQQITKRFPQFIGGWIDLGQGYQMLGLYDRAIGNLHHVLELEPGNLIAIKAQVGCLEKAGRLQEADRLIASGLKIAPSDVDLREMELERELIQGDPRRLLAPREAALKREPARIDNVIALARVYLRINRTEGLSNPQGAHDALSKAVELLNGAVKKWPADKDCAFWAAHTAALMGDVAGGKQILRRLCEQSAWSNRPEADEALADLCITWGDLHGAEAALRDAIARGAKDAVVARRLAGVLMRMGAWQPALDALRDFPNDPLAQQQRIVIVVSAGQGALAERELQNAHAADPYNARLMTLLGVLYSSVHIDTQAKLWLDRAFAAGDEEPAGRARGALLRQEKNPDLKGAIQDLAIAHEANPADGPTALFYSDVYLRQNDATDANRVLESTLAINPSAKDVRLGLIALKEASATPDWDRIVSLIDAGRTRLPSDWGWDALEARMWSSRHDAARAAALMRHAVQVAQTAPEVADATMESQDSRQVRALIPSELWMLLEAQAYDVVINQADAVISRYGSRDMLSAWAHHAKASVQRRTGRDDGGTAEYRAAFATAQAAGGFPAASTIAETISSDSGPDEAIRQINAYVGSAGGRRETSDAGLGHDARWDVLRIDLFRRNNELSAAAAEIDKLMPHLSEIPAGVQVQLLRMAVVIYLQAPTTSQSDKAANACLALLQRSPQDVWALNNMAGIYMDHANPRQPEKALDYGQRAYRGAGQMGEVDPQITDTYGWALAGTGHASEAIELLKSAAERLDIPDVQYHLAEAYLAAGTPALAGRHLQTAIELVRRDQKQGRPVDSRLRTDIANACWRAIGQTTVADVTSFIGRCSTAAHAEQ